MNRLPILNHVAILVPSAESAAKTFRDRGFNVGPAEKWDGEGTLEIYVEREKSASLLLMEPVKKGAYLRALKKRGPGLHHLAIDVLNIEDYLTKISGSGWLLHPSSIQTLKRSKTAYLARPGFPSLVEVQQREEIGKHDPFVEEIGLQLGANSKQLLQAIGLQETVRGDASTWIRCGTFRASLSEIWEKS